VGTIKGRVRWYQHSGSIIVMGVRKKRDTTRGSPWKNIPFSKEYERNQTMKDHHGQKLSLSHFKDRYRAVL